jgi:predicted small lipoprotein YifL
MPMRTRLRSARALLATLTLAGCGGEAAPSAPPFDPVPPAPPPAVAPTSRGGAFVWGVVLTRDGGCIAGATLRVVGGQALGDSLTQRAPCGPWDDAGGFAFTGLTSGVPLTIRASAAGYVSKEVTLVPDFGPQRAMVIELERVVP